MKSNNISNFPKPQRLVMIRIVDVCSFCKDPKGHALLYLVSQDDNYGFLSCPNCTFIAENAVKDWIDKFAYGSANHLKNKSLKVRRTSGVIEDNWRLSSTSTMIYYDVIGKECVKLINGEQIYKMVPIDDLLLLNE
jgi:hypothetical protein